MRFSDIGRTDRPAAKLLLAAGLCLAGLRGEGQTVMQGFQPVIARIQLDRDAVKPGETLRVGCVWFNAGDAPARNDYRVFLHARLIGAAEDGSYPMFGGDYEPVVETYRWYPRRVLRETEIPLRVPPDARPGRYALLAGLYDDAGRARLAVPADLLTPEFGPDRAKVAEFTVLAPGETAAGKPLARDLAPLPAAPPQWPRQPAAGNDLVLDGGAWQARLAPDAPLLRRLVRGGRRLAFDGGDPEDVPFITLCRGGDNRRATSRQANVAVEYRRLDTGEPGRIAYAATVYWDRVAAVAMRFDYTAEPDGLHIAVRQIREYPPCQLMAVTFPSLVSLPGSAPGAALVSPEDAGRLIPLVASAPKREYLPLGWYAGALLAMAQQRNAVAVLEPDSLEDSLRVQVTEEEGRGEGARGRLGTRYSRLPTHDSAPLRGALGVRLVYRLEGKDAAHRLRVQESMGARLTLVDGPGVDWTSAAKRARQRHPAALAPLYRRALIYKIFCDVPQAAQPAATFDQALALIRRIAALTDNAPQIAYLVGWQYQGHDTGYPAVDRVNARLGGLEDMQRLIAEARKVNALVSAHDNYDDAYRDSPAWDESLIARDANGELMKGGVWAGGQSYILSPARYTAGGKAQARVQDTLDRYPFRETYHIDVLAASPLIHDQDPAHPADAAGSVLGKLAIVKAFAARGVDVSSEALTAPFVGPITYFWHLERRRALHFPGERPIPLLPFLYHGAAGYGGGIGPADADVLDALRYGANWSEDVTAATPMEPILDRFFFVNLPWQALNTRPMQVYRALPDGTERVGYGPDTFVETNRAAGTYRVVVDGQVLSQDFRTVAPRGAGKWLAYTRAAQPLALPPGAKQVFRLSADGSRAPVTVTGGAFHAEARTPYLLTE